MAINPYLRDLGFEDPSTEEDDENDPLMRVLKKLLGQAAASAGPALESTGSNIVEGLRSLPPGLQALIKEGVERGYAGARPIQENVLDPLFKKIMDVTQPAAGIVSAGLRGPEYAMGSLERAGVEPGTPPLEALQQAGQYEYNEAPIPVLTGLLEQLPLFASPTALARMGRGAAARQLLPGAPAGSLGTTSGVEAIAGRTITPELRAALGSGADLPGVPRGVLSTAAPQADDLTGQILQGVVANLEKGGRAAAEGIGRAEAGVARDVFGVEPPTPVTAGARRPKKPAVPADPNQAAADKIVEDLFNRGNRRIAPDALQDQLIRLHNLGVDIEPAVKAMPAWEQALREGTAPGTALQTVLEQIPRNADDGRVILGKVASEGTQTPPPAAQPPVTPEQPPARPTAPPVASTAPRVEITASRPDQTGNIEVTARRYSADGKVEWSATARGPISKANELAEQARAKALAGGVDQPTTPPPSAAPPPPPAATGRPLTHNLNPEKIDIKAAGKILDDAEAAGYDVTDARSALDDLIESTRDDFDSALEFKEYKAETWEEILNTLDDVEPLEGAVGRSVQEIAAGWSAAKTPAQQRKFAASLTDDEKAALKKFQEDQKATAGAPPDQPPPAAAPEPAPLPPANLKQLRAAHPDAKFAVTGVQNGVYNIRATLKHPVTGNDVVMTGVGVDAKSAITNLNEKLAKLKGGLPDQAAAGVPPAAADAGGTTPPGEPPAAPPAGDLGDQFDDAAAKLTGGRKKSRAEEPPPDEPIAEEPPGKTRTRRKKPETFEDRSTLPGAPTRQEIDPIVDRVILWMKRSREKLPEVAETISEERARRVAAASKELSTGGGSAQFVRARKQLAGEIGKQRFFAPTEEFTKQEFDALSNFIVAQPVTFFEKQRAWDALNHLLVGIPIQKNELALLDDIFGAKLGRALTRRGPGWWASNIWNAPTALLASFDLSNPFRQGVFLLPGHPKAWAKSWAPMLKAVDREAAAGDIYEAMINTPSGKIGRALGLDLANPTSAQGSARTEAYVSTLFDDPEIFGGALAKTVGKIIEPSNRAFASFGNKQRLEIFDNTLANWFGADNLPQIADDVLKASHPRAIAKVLDGYIPQGLGVKGSDVKLLADFLNDATGRSTLLNMQKYAPVLNALFFAPRFMMSRILIPTKWLAMAAVNPTGTMGTELRKLILKDMAAFVATGVGVLTFLKATGAADVEVDPRSSDFGKIRVGPVRLDFWGGFQQWARYMTQVATGQRKTLGAEEIREMNRGEALFKLFLTKLKPTNGSTLAVVTGTDLTGEDARVVVPPGVEAGDNIRRLITKNIIPLGLQDIAETRYAIKQSGGDLWAQILGTAGVSPLSVSGFGVTSFDTPENRIPEWRIFQRREEIIARKFVEKYDLPRETFDLLVSYFQVRPGSPLGIGREAEEKRSLIESNIKNPDLLRDFDRAADLFEKRLATKYPSILEQLRAQGHNRWLNFTPDEKPTPEYAANPRRKDGTITQAYARQLITNAFFKAYDWDVEVPEGKATPPYNWLPEEYQVLIDQWLKDANAKTYDLYGGSRKDAWWELGAAARAHVAKLVGDPKPAKGIRPYEVVKDLMDGIDEEVASDAARR